MREILEAIGEDPDRDGLVRTPARIAHMYEEIFAGLHEDPSHHLTVTFEAEPRRDGHGARHPGALACCEHHLVPFAGRAHVAYIPGADGRITGLSKIARLVDGFAKRPQVQERLTTQIADALVEVLDPAGVLVMIEAEHFCMSMRGVKKPGSLTITSRGAWPVQEQCRHAGRGHEPHHLPGKPPVSLETRRTCAEATVTLGTRPRYPARNVRLVGGLWGAPRRDGHRERHARLVLRRRAVPRPRRRGRPRARARGAPAPTSSTSAASPPGPAPRPSATTKSSAGSSRSSSAWPPRRACP